MARKVHLAFRGRGGRHLVISHEEGHPPNDDQLKEMLAEHRPCRPVPLTSIPRSERQALLAPYGRRAVEKTKEIA